MAIMLSIDWDFFVRVEGETPESKVTVFPGTPQEEVAPAIMLFDWGHNEGMPAMLQSMRWLSRYAAFKNRGIDAEKLVTIDPARGCVTPEKFSDDTFRRFARCEDSPLWISDSHTHGFHAAEYAWRENHRRPVRVVHFDAHADLGYGADGAAMWHDGKRVDCANWLFAAMEMGYVKSVEIVYPDWRGMKEWKRFEKEDHLKFYRSKKKLKAFNWSEYMQTKPRSEQVVITHLCRSSSWTPPWLDTRFDQFIRSLYWKELLCLDCTEDVSERHIGPHDACKPRAWDRADADRYAAELAATFARVQAARTIMD